MKNTFGIEYDTRETAATALRLSLCFDLFPKVARTSQPWAGGRNPFGIVRARTRFDLIRPIPSYTFFAIQIQIRASTRPSWPPRRFDENDSTAPRLRLQVCRHRVPVPCDHR